MRRNYAVQRQVRLPSPARVRLEHTNAAEQLNVNAYRSGRE